MRGARNSVAPSTQAAFAGINGADSGRAEARNRVAELSQCARSKDRAAARCYGHNESSQGSGAGHGVSFPEVSLPDRSTQRTDATGMDTRLRHVRVRELR